MKNVIETAGNTEPSEERDGRDTDAQREADNIDDRANAERTVSYAGEIVVPEVIRPYDPRWDPIAGGL